MCIAREPIGVDVEVLVAASWLSPRSLSIKDAPNPPLYSLEEGTLGWTPGQGLYVSTDQHLPVAEPKISAKSFGSRPRLEKANLVDDFNHSYCCKD